VGKQTGDGGEEVDDRGDRLVSMTKKLILMMVLAAVFLPLDVATLITITVGCVYVFRNPFRRLLGY